MFRAYYFLILKSCYLGNPVHFICSVNTYWKAVTQSSFWDISVLFEDAKEGNREYDLFFCKPQNPAFSLSSSFAFAQRPPEPNVSAATAKSLQSCPTLCDPVDGSLPGSLVLGILQARTLEWVAISFSNEWKWKVKVKLLSRGQLSDPMDCSPPGSSIHGIFQARVLELGAIAFSGPATAQMSPSF